MRYFSDTYQLGFGKLTPGVKWLLYANGGVYLIQILFGQPIIDWFALRSDMILNYFAIWQFVTYMFLHEGFLHIFFNMFMLWIFGCEVERMWGKKEFLQYYFLTGIGAGVLHFLISLVTHGGVMGASGAVYGVMLAFALIFPERVITLLIFFILPVSIKVKYLVMILAGISVFLGISNLFGESSDMVAHFAHLGGMAAGLLYLKSDWRTRNIVSTVKRTVKKRSVKMDIYRSENKEDLQKQVDVILDKINEVGYEKLSNSEKNLLKRASEDLSKKSKQND